MTLYNILHCEILSIYIYKGKCSGLFTKSSNCCFIKLVACQRILLSSIALNKIFQALFHDFDSFNLQPKQYNLNKHGTPKIYK